MSKIKVKLVKSKIGAKPDQRKTLEALGLKRINFILQQQPDDVLF